MIRMLPSPECVPGYTDGSTMSPTTSPTRHTSKPRALGDTLTVMPWTDPVIDQDGHHPRSSYVEDYWMAILVPTAYCLLRKLSAGVDHDPDGYMMDPSATATEMGLGSGTGSSSQLARSLDRLELFALVRRRHEEVWCRRRLPLLHRRQRARLPEHLGRSHAFWQQQQDDEQYRASQLANATVLASALVQLGHLGPAIENRLHEWRYSPVTSRAAALAVATPS